MNLNWVFFSSDGLCGDAQKLKLPDLLSLMLFPFALRTIYHTQKSRIEFGQTYYPFTQSVPSIVDLLRPGDRDGHKAEGVWSWQSQTPTASLCVWNRKRERDVPRRCTLPQSSDPKLYPGCFRPGREPYPAFCLAVQCQEPSEGTMTHTQLKKNWKHRNHFRSGKIYEFSCLKGVNTGASPSVLWVGWRVHCLGLSNKREAYPELLEWPFSLIKNRKDRR